MVEAIGVAILTAVGSAEIASTVVIAGTTLATIVGTTVVLGGSLALSALTTPSDRQKVASQQYGVKQSLPPRKRSYGRVKLAGPYIAWNSTGGAFYTGIYLGEGPYEVVEEYYLDDLKAALAAGAASGIAGIDPWQNAVALEVHLGTVPQTASALLRDISYWTVDHRLDGCAYIVMRAQAPEEDKFRRVYPTGSFPLSRAVLRASKVRNPAVPAQTEDPATWAWSELCTPCIRDLLTHPLCGFKVPASLIDDVSFAQATAVDGQMIPDKFSQIIPRYRLSGTFDLTEEPASILQAMLDARDGSLYLTPEGKIGMTGGRYLPPEVTIGQDAIVSIGTLEVGNGLRASFNRLKTSYVSPLHDYQQVEGDPWEDLDGQAQAGVLEADFSRPWVNTHNQLRRLAKIHTEKQNPAYRITGLVTNRRGLPALYEDAITLALPRYGITAVFTVTRAVAAADGSSCVFDLTSLDPSAYAFDPTTEEGVAPALPSQDAATAPPDPPVALTATIERRPMGGGTPAYVILSAQPPARADQSLIGRYRQAGTTIWIPMGAEGDTRGRVVSQALGNAMTYEVQGAISGYGNASQSVYTPEPPLTVTT